AGAATEAAGRQAEQVREQIESLRKSHEAANREIAGLREHAGVTRQELQQTLKSSGSMRSELEATAARLGEAEKLFREAAQQFVADLRGQITPLFQGLREAAPPLEHFPAQ